VLNPGFTAIAQTAPHRQPTGASSAPATMSSPVPISFAAGAAALPDSLYTWVFEASSGNRWGGWLVADSIAYTTGDSLTTAHGRYLILAEEERGLDLSALGLEDGDVRVEWYFDAGSGQFLVTRNGPGTTAGTEGLGSEMDAAWTASGWAGFGRGGAAQVSVPANARFTWVFEADSGDRMEGTLAGIAGSFAPGDAVRTAFGSYRILGQQVLDASDPAVAQLGQVRLTRYFDAATGRDLLLEKGGAAAAGSGGLGSELDRAWTGSAWVNVGQGGRSQADGAFSFFAWRFEANSGDRMQGVLFDAALAFQPGDVLTTAAGRYVIETEVPHAAGRSHDPGTVWLDTYFDAASGTTMKGYMLHTAGQASLGRGLGNEEDWVFDGDEWDAVGRGGALQSDVETYAWFTWRFEANSGDLVHGFLFDLAGAFSPGQALARPAGRYVIETTTPVGLARSHAEGTVWVDRYFDAQSGTTMKAFMFHSAGQASVGRGLGNEQDWVFDGQEWVAIGQAGALQASIETHSWFGWRFEAASGDRYSGFLFDRASAFQPGDTLAGAAGRYVIETEAAAGTARPFAAGTVWLDTYFDAGSGITMKGFMFHTAGQPSVGRGLGNEQDWVFDGNDWDAVGQGGALQSDVETYAWFTWRFEANSGDRYSGFLFEEARAFQPGDVLARAAGRYVIETEAAAGTARVVPAGTVWIDTYLDAQSGTTMKGYMFHTAGQPSVGRGLGNEQDWVFDGDEWDAIGQGGALQSDVETFAWFTWRFEANSGDRYSGFLFEEARAFQPGDVLARAAGRYVIEAEIAAGTSRLHPAGTVWIDTYRDAGSGLTMKGYMFHTAGQPSVGRGLGNEQDWVWDGDGWDAVGRAGTLQSDIEPFG
jgi:hypothetical protein